MRPVWDPCIGFALADGFEERFPKIGVRGAVDAGPARQRRVTTSSPGPIQVAYYMTTAERRWLRDFYMGEGGPGVWFVWQHPVEQRRVLARFVVGEEPSYQAKRPNWIVAVSLEWRDL
jgi:hypothetical protein